MIRTAFNPIQHGFKFRNAFANHLISVPSLGINITTQGRCGGMAFAALDYWYNHLAVPEDSSLPVDGTLVSTYIYNRLMTSIMANALKFFNVMRTPINPTWFGIGVGRATREQEFPGLQRLIAQGRPCVLGLANAKDVGGFGNDHQVVAYGYEVGIPYSTILIYDNNYPNEEVRLTFKTAYDPSEREVHHSHSHDWRGFFVESYAPQLPNFLANGSLLSEISQAENYVVRGGGRFLIPSQTEFDDNGFYQSQILETVDGSMQHVSTYPANGTLIRERNANAVYVIYGGVPFPIPSDTVFNALGFQWPSVLIIPAGSMGGLRTFPADGTLLREFSASEVYLADNGKLRLVPTAEFNDRFSLANVGIVPDAELERLKGHNRLNDHFYTTNGAERDYAVANAGYYDEGIACHVFAVQVSETTPLYRLYRLNNVEHFYTIDVAERDNAVAYYGYHYEGVACYVFATQAPGTTPLYRLNNGEHFYTIDEAVRNNALANGYSDEGVACYVFATQTTPLFRLFKV